MSLERGIVVFALATAVALGSRRAGAVPPEAAVLFQEGRRLLAAGRTDEACERFAASYAIEASSGTLLNLALCHERQGKWATAWSEYRSAADLARAQSREDRARVADDKVAELEAKLPRMIPVPAKPVPGLRVATEGISLDQGGFGVATPLDPGPHTITVSAPGYRPWSSTVEMKEGQVRTLEIPELEAELSPAAAPQSIQDERASPAPSRPDAPNPAARGASLDLYLAAGGGLAIVSGAAIWGIAYANFQAAQDACNQGCSQADRNSRVSSITTLQTIAIGSWIGGGALLLASGLHYWLAGNERGSAPSTAIGVAPLAGGVQISLRGVY
jgi:tetratricopeptide (TPR) repeat protein